MHICVTRPSINELNVLNIFLPHSYIYEYKAMIDDDSDGWCEIHYMEGIDLPTQSWCSNVLVQEGNNAGERLVYGRTLPGLVASKVVILTTSGANSKVKLSIMKALSFYMYGFSMYHHNGNENIPTLLNESEPLMKVCAISPWITSKIFVRFSKAQL